MVIQTRILGVDLVLETTDGLFSPGSVDRGTLAMLSCASFRPGEHVLDLGCGYGVVGIVAARLAGEAGVVMLDNDPAAVAAAARNAVRNGVAGVRTILSDGLSGLDDAGYDWILSNPPYHADFAVARKFIEKGFNRLRIGGRMLMVTKRRDWYRNKFTAVFGGVRITEKDGYYVFFAERRQAAYAEKGRARKSPSHLQHPD